MINFDDIKHAISVLETEKQEQEKAIKAAALVKQELESKNILGIRQ